MSSHTVYIGIGSNIDAERNLKACADMLRADYPDIAFSPVYKTAARDVEEQEDFLNAAARFSTDETPEDVQETLWQIEKELGKNPPYPKGPRTIDVDILLYGDMAPLTQKNNGHKTQDTSTHLIIPHPRMHERRFVLEPLCELIDPTEKHPSSGKTWNELLQQVEGQKCEQIGLKL